MTRLKVLAAVLIWGASFAFTKRVLSEVSPLSLVLARCALGSLVMLACVRRKRLFKGLGVRGWLELLAISLSGVLGQQLIQAFSLRHTSAMHAGWILSATPIVVALAMAGLFGERMGRARWSGFFLGALGTVLVVSSRQVVAGAGLVTTWRGDLLFMTSCLNWAFYVIITDRWLKSWPQQAVTTMSMVMGLAIILPICLGSGQWHELLHVSRQGWLCLGYLGVLSSGAGYLFWNAAVEEIGPSASSAFLYMEPFASLVTAKLILGEAIAPLAVLGGILILVGVYRVNAGRALPGVPEEAV
jgi:drug/metabolite transporter (DMT)-like permease